MEFKKTFFFYITKNEQWMGLHLYINVILSHYLIVSIYSDLKASQYKVNEN